MKFLYIDIWLIRQSIHNKYIFTPTYMYVLPPECIFQSNSSRLAEIQGWTQTFRPNILKVNMSVYPLGTFQGCKQHSTANTSGLQIETLIFYSDWILAIIIHFGWWIHSGGDIYIIQCDAIRWEQFWCGDVILDNFNIVYSDEDSISGQNIDQTFMDFYYEDFRF